MANDGEPPETDAQRLRRIHEARYNVTHRSANDRGSRDGKAVVVCMGCYEEFGDEAYKSHKCDGVRKNRGTD